jgi:geranylgeranyl reductase
MEKVDVVIVGAGPAGLAAAKMLGEKRRKVLLVEKKEKIGPKVCAGGLTKKTLSLGLPLSLADKIFYSVNIHYSKKTIAIKDKNPLVVTISREALANWQLQQISGNVAILKGVRVIRITPSSILLENGKEIGFSYLIGADGSQSLVRRYLQLPTEKVWWAIQYKLPKVFPHLEIYFDPIRLGSGYVWIFPHKDFTFIGCGCQLGDKKEKEIFNSFHSWLEENKIDYEKGELESSIINFDFRGFQFGNVFLIGDAGGFASGLTGEGIYFAIVSGQEIAKKILNPNYNLIKLKKILKIKKYQETFGKLLLFKVLRVKPLTRFLFKRYI